MIIINQYGPKFPYEYIYIYTEQGVEKKKTRYDVIIHKEINYESSDVDINALNHG